MGRGGRGNKPGRFIVAAILRCGFVSVQDSHRRDTRQNLSRTGTTPPSWPAICDNPVLQQMAGHDGGAAILCGVAGFS